MEAQQVIEKLRAHQGRLEEFSVRSLSVFGSVVRGEADAESDVDLLVEFQPDARIGLFTFVHLRDVLTEILECPVDLVTREALHPTLKESILREAVHVG